MKKINKKTLSLSTETLRSLRSDELGGAAGGLPVSQTVAYSICWSCGTQGAARGCCEHASSIPGAGCE
jgi:hypothetical protein